MSRPSTTACSTRRRPIAVALASLVALGVLLLSSLPASAQTAVTLVSNTGETAHSTDQQSIFFDAAQAFTTGTNSLGYRLTEVELQVQMSAGSGAPTSYSVKICEVSGSDPSGTCPGTLTNPATLQNGANAFTSSSGIDLSANTTYAVFVDYGSGGSGTIGFLTTSSDVEDAGKAAGWSIANERRTRLSATWAGDTEALHLAIKGYAKTPTPTTGLRADPDDTKVTLHWNDPSNSSITKYQYRQSIDGGTTWSPDWTDIASSGATTTSHEVTGLANGTTYTFELRAVAGTTNFPSARISATPGATLVRNLNKPANVSTSVINNDVAQAFTTGAETTGYRLTKVVLGMRVGPAAVTPTDYSVQVCNDSSNAPGATCDTLEKPALLVEGGGNWFTAAGAGIDLSANTTYWVVVDSVSGGSGTVNLRDTEETGEDTESQTGWSMADTRLSRGRATTTWGSAVANPFKVGVYGYTRPALEAPAGLSATPGDDQVPLSWTAATDTTITRYQYRVSADGGTTWNPDWTDISGSGVTTTSYTVTGLSFGTSYTIELRAVAGSVNGASASVSATTTTPPPSAPAGLTATPGDATVSLSWTDPGNATVTKYQYRVSTDGGTTWNPDWTDVTGSSATTTSHEVTGLTNGTTYTLGVRAVAGSVIGASASASATPAAPLVKNLNMSAFGAAGTDIVANDAAQAFTTGSNGPGYILSYVILGAGGSGTPPGPSGYSVKVCNNDASGAIHVPGTTCTDLSEPAALAGGGTDVFAAAAGMSLSESTTYWVVFDSVSGGTGTWELRRTTDDGEDTGVAAGFSVADDGLTRARATTTWSTDNNPLKLGVYGYAKTGPSPPTGLSAVVSRGQAALSWTASTYPGVTRYQYRASADGGTSWDPDWTDVPGGAGATSYTVRNLTDGTTHTTQVRTVAGTVNGTAASVTAALPHLPPPAPGGLTAAPGDAQIALTWTDPSDSVITKYQVRQRAGNGNWTDWTDVPSSGPATTTHTVVGLANWTRYTVELRAVRGADALSASGASAGVSAAPTGPFVSTTGQGEFSTLSAGLILSQIIRVAQVFTTGDHSGGYRLTEVDMDLGGNIVNENADIRASIFATTGDPPVPDTSGDALYVLTNPETPPDNAVGTFTAPANATLAANTSYALVMESTTTKVPNLEATNSDTPDAGTASGWSIADHSHRSVDGGVWRTDESTARIAIKGTPRSAPVFAGGGFGGGGGGGGSAPSPSTVDFEWTVEHDIESLHTRHTVPTGMWSDGKTLWLAHNDGSAGDAVYAYDVETGERVPEREPTLEGRNRAPRGLASDGVTVWVSDSGRDRLFAYDLATGKALPERDIELARGNRDARGAWTRGGVIWVLNRNPSLFVYDIESGALRGEYELDSRNSDPRGAWSDGVSVWVSDHGAKRLFAYRLPEPPAAGTPAPEDPPALERVPGEDFTELGKVSNLSPRGIWSDGAVMYVADANDGKVYSYNMPDAIDARLASLSLDGVEIGEFDARSTAYDGVPGEGVTVTVVTAEATQDDATVAIEPPDADEATDGHQVALAGRDGTTVTVTVTSADGSRTRDYVVAVEAVEQAWAHSLKGAVAEGFSLLVYEGGSVEELATAAGSRGVTSLYALHQGDYIPYILEAPAFVNRDFVELFTDGVPALTPLIVKSDGPPSGDPVGDVAPPADWSGCLLGEVVAGFSTVVYAGGSVEELADCAGSRGVTALYALDDGEWAAYILAAPDFVNRDFGELFADGVPALTPFVVKGEEPAPAGPAEADDSSPPAASGDATPDASSSEGGTVGTGDRAPE